MVMSLMILKDEITDWLKDKEQSLNNWLFWPIKQEISLQQQRLFIAVMALFSLLLSFLLI